MSLRWASQKPTTVATVSQIAVLRGGGVSWRSAYDVTPLGLPGANECGDSFADRRPQGAARSRGDP
eukprot:2608353-Pyramimonas_sp.AAC.1